MVHNTTSLGKLVHEGMREWGIALHGSGRTFDEARANMKRAYAFPQILYMSCGHKQMVESFDEIPLHDIRCPCKNPNHWIVRYDILRPKRKSIFRRLIGCLLRS